MERQGNLPNQSSTVRRYAFHHTDSTVFLMQVAAGSVIAALAGTSNVLIMGRTLSGVGAAGIGIGGLQILKVYVEERLQGIVIGVVFAVLGTYHLIIPPCHLKDTNCRRRYQQLSRPPPRWDNHRWYRVALLLLAQHPPGCYGADHHDPCRYAQD